MSKQSELKKDIIPFTQIPNELILNPKISLQAKSIYAYLQSKPENWRFYNHGIAKELGITEKLVIKYIKELVNMGWVESKMITVNGRFSHKEYRVFFYQKSIGGKSANGNSSKIKKNTKNSRKSTVTKKEDIVKTQVISIDDRYFYDEEITKIPSVEKRQSENDRHINKELKAGVLKNTQPISNIVNNQHHDKNFKEEYYDNIPRFSENPTGRFYNMSKKELDQYLEDIGFC